MKEKTINFTLRKIWKRTFHIWKDQMYLSREY